MKFLSTQDSSVKSAGFTLIELLVVISIISILIAILLPALAKARVSSYQAMDQSNLRQLYIAAASYAGDYRGVLPQGSSLTDDPQGDYTCSMNPDGDSVTPGNQPTALQILIRDTNYVNTDNIVKSPAMDIPIFGSENLVSYSYRYNESGTSQAGSGSYDIYESTNSSTILSDFGIDKGALFWSASDYRRHPITGETYNETTGSTHLMWPYKKFGYAARLDGVVVRAENHVAFDLYIGVYAQGAFPAPSIQIINYRPTSWFSGVDFSIR